MRPGQSLVLLALLVFSSTGDPQGANALTQGSEGTARLIGAESELTQLRNRSGGDGPSDRWQILWLHQVIAEKVEASSLQVDATIAQIDNEIARADEVRSYLSDRRDRAVSRANLLSATLGGAIGATSSGLQLSPNLAKPSAAVGISAGALSASLGLLGIRAQSGKSSHFDFDSNMLAEIFGRSPVANSHYSETVWKFLNEVAPSAQGTRTRREELIQVWVQVKRIDSTNDSDKIDRVTSEPSEQVKLNIDDFEDRAAMLRDVRARISYLKRDLGALLISLPTGPARSGNLSDRPDRQLYPDCAEEQP